MTTLYDEIHELIRARLTAAVREVYPDATAPSMAGDDFSLCHDDGGFSVLFAAGGATSPRVSGSLYVTTTSPGVFVTLDDHDGRGDGATFAEALADLRRRTAEALADDVGGDA